MRVIQSNDLVAYEDLNVKGMVKNQRLAKSINDAAWATFRQWLEYFGFKYGKVTIAVPPHNTSQNCSNCGEKVQKTLSTRTHICSHCGYIEDRDINAAINILKKAIQCGLGRGLQAPDAGSGVSPSVSRREQLNQEGLSTLGHSGSKAWGDLPSGLVGEILLGDGESVNQESPVTASA